MVIIFTNQASDRVDLCDGEDGFSGRDLFCRILQQDGGINTSGESFGAEYEGEEEPAEQYVVIGCLWF